MTTNLLDQTYEYIISKDNRKKQIPQSEKLGYLTQRLIIAKLNHCFKGRLFTLVELAELMEVEISALRCAVKELEEHKLAHRETGTGKDMHKVFLDWDKG